MESKTYRAIRIHKFGEPFVIETLQIPKPSKNQVLVKIHYGAIHPGDLLIAKGLYPYAPQPPLTLGAEGSGVIVEVGPELEIQHKVGDRVVIVGFQVWGEYALLKSDQVYNVLPENTLEEAATSFANQATVLRFIEHEVIKGGHKAVVHSLGASAVGKLLIRELKELGIKSINLVRRDEYIQPLKDIGADYVLNTKDADFEANLKKIAAEVQATIAFEGIGGEISGKILNALPPKSQFLIYGGQESSDLRISAGSLFEGKVVRAFTVTWYLGDPKVNQELAQVIQKKLKTTLKTDISRIFGFEEVKEAIEFFQANASKGKVLLKFV